MHGYEAIADALVREGVEHVFAVAGEDTMEMLVELKESGRVQVIQARKECGAAGMADGYSRVTGKPGVCIVTVGPGLTNTATALTTANRHQSPVLCITTELSPFDRNNPKGGGLDQRQFSEATAGTYMEVRNAETLAEDVQAAFRHIHSAAGPVVLSVPVGVMKGELDMDWEYIPGKARIPAVQRSHPDPKLIANAADILGMAEKTVILAGRGAYQSQAEGEIRALAERTGALLATTLRAKGFLSDHPYNVGIAGFFAPERMLGLLSQADCILAVGCSLHHYTTQFGLLSPDAQIIHVDRNPGQVGRTTEVKLGIVGDARASLAALNSELEKRHFVQKSGFWDDDVRSVIAASRVIDQCTYVDDPNTIDPCQLVVELDKILPNGRIVVADAGFFSTFVVGSISARDPSDFVWTSDFGSVGMGLFQGVGAAVGRPDRHVVVIAGDGGFMMTLEELDTAVRERIPMTLVIMNDNAFGIEVHLLEAQGKPVDIALYESPDFAKLAEGFGAVGLTVRKAEDLRAVAAAIGKGDRPVVVDARVNGAVIPEVWSKIHHMTSH